MDNYDVVVESKPTSNILLNRNNNLYTKFIAMILILTFLLGPGRDMLCVHIDRQAMKQDQKATEQIVNIVKTAMSDDSIYLEVKSCSMERNYSCYADGNGLTNIKENKIAGTAISYWKFNDKCRTLDNVIYQPTGMMMGVTITFIPNNKSEYTLSNAWINCIDRQESESVYDTRLERLPKLYAAIQEAVGKSIPIKSPAYKNSNFTIFIDLDANATVYGQYNGTNLSSVAQIAEFDTSTQIEDYIPPKSEITDEMKEEAEEKVFAKKKAEKILWDGYQFVIGQDIWSYNGTYYYSYPEDDVCYVLKDNTWEPCTNEHPDVFYGQCVWSDGQNTYLSVGKDNYVFDGKTWKSSPWNNDAEIYGNHIWSHNNQIYMSVMLQDSEDQHKFIFKHYLYKNNQWEAFEWSGFNNVSGNHVWSDGTNTYYSCEEDQYILKNNKWEAITWKGVSDIVGINVWTDGTNVFYSYGEEQYILQGDTWKKIVWEDGPFFYGVNVWKYGDSYCVSDMGTYMFTE